MLHNLRTTRGLVMESFHSDRTVVNEPPTLPVDTRRVPLRCSIGGATVVALLVEIALPVRFREGAKGEEVTLDPPSPMRQR